MAQQPLRIPKAYINWAKAVINSFWTKPLDKGQSPLLSKAQIRQQILDGVARMQAEDGDSATWTPCDHCNSTGMFESYGPVKSQVGVVGQPDMVWTEALCYQCKGKGRQSAADRKRNWGYQAHRTELEESL